MPWMVSTHNFGVTAMVFILPADSLLPLAGLLSTNGQATNGQAGYGTMRT